MINRNTLQKTITLERKTKLIKENLEVLNKIGKINRKFSDLGTTFVVRNVRPPRKLRNLGRGGLVRRQILANKLGQDRLKLLKRKEEIHKFINLPIKKEDEIPIIKRRLILNGN